MRGALRRALLTLLVGSTLAGGGPAPAHANPAASESQLMAAFLYNFVRFTNWPSEAETTVIVVFGQDPFEGKLDAVLEKGKIARRVFQVQHVDTVEDCAGADVVVFGEDMVDQLVASAFEARPVLTVGEGIDFVERGGIIAYYREGQKLRFAVNPDAANKNDLNISANLLRLARIVAPEATGGSP